MSRLDHIPKQTVFTVPDGYFEKLPAKIQARISTIAEDNHVNFWQRNGFRYAVPLAVIVGAIIYYSASLEPDAEAMLAGVETADLILYVQETSLMPTTEELLEEWDISPIELEAIEDEVYDLHLEQTADEALESELNNL